MRLMSRLVLSRSSHRMEDRRGISQEKAEQGRSPPAGIPRPMPRLCRQMGGRAKGTVSAPWYLGDWDDPYLTMKYEAEAAIVAELLKFAESGQLYRGAKPVMWSPVATTALARAEVE